MGGMKLKQNDTMRQKRIEKMSSAVTLSDMEIFIFPELMIAGTLANLMSPLVWEWRQDPWFKDMDKLSPYQRVLKVKQYIMDHYIFNLDLETWGLTEKSLERARFEPFVDFGEVEASNALMGYEGDRYYYDIDIRSHFGLDRYTTDILPYWKTETVEAMTAFRYKPDHRTGAGECVSLSMLYFAALHIVAGIPLDDIYMVATPLHSQNLVALGDGFLTNNRRIVTKSMWSNGTPISQKARRALVNEKVTIVANLHGYVHTMYDEATMTKEEYQKFEVSLTEYLRPVVTGELFYAFLRQAEKWQRLFYFYFQNKKESRYLNAEALFAREAESSLRLAPQSVGKLMRKEADALDAPPVGRFPLQTLEERDFARLQYENREEWPALIGGMLPFLTPEEAEALAREFMAFSYVMPRLPGMEKTFTTVASPLSALETCDSAEEVIAFLDGLRGEHEIADLAFAAYRDLTRSCWCPFLRAALERNPVSVQAMQSMCSEEAYRHLLSLNEKSIYGRYRLAQPDEVFNFGMGDGLEKAICLWNHLWSKEKNDSYSLVITGREVHLRTGDRNFVFHTEKGLPEQVVYYEDAPICAPEPGDRRHVAAL